MHASFALYRLYHDGDGIFCTRLLKGFQIVEGCIAESGGHIPKAFLACIVRLSCSAHGSEGTSVEGFFCCYNIVFMGTVLLYSVFSRHFDHSFVCFGTGILEEDLVHIQCGAYFFRQKRLGDRIWIVEGMHDVSYLISYGCHNFFIAVSGRVYGDSCIEIQVGRSIFIIKVHALCRLSQKVETLVCLDHIFLYLVLDVLYC